MDGEILYVDDQSMLTRPLRELLESETLRKVHYARNISSALSILEDPSITIALVLLDVSFAAGEETLFQQDPEGISTGLIAIPMLRTKLKKEAAIWLVTIRVPDLKRAEVEALGIPWRHVYAKPLRDPAGFLKDVKQHLEAA